jgi:hypothetical protein
LGVWPRLLLVPIGAGVSEMLTRLGR